MPDVNQHTNHNDNDIIIRDQDGTYKILREGKFVPLDEAKAPSGDTGPKRAPDAKPVVVPKPAPAPAPAPVVPPPLAVKPAATPAPAPIAPKPAPVAVPLPPKPQPTAKPSEPISSQPPVRGMADQELLAQADAIINKSGVTFASGEVRGRVAKALVAHIKQVRKPFETRESLMKPIKDGGAGLTEGEANTIMDAAGAPKEAAPSGVKPVTKPENPVVKPVTSTMAPIGKEVSMPAKVAIDTYAAVDAPYFKVSPQEAKQAFSMPSVSAPRASLADVQKPSRSLGGPVEELAYDITTWRRLAPNPADRIKKIESQLDLLEQDGFTQRLRGIQSWRSSDVVKVYLAAAKQSLEEGKPLKEILGSGSPTLLSWEEWQAVAELDDRLIA